VNILSILKTIDAPGSLLFLAVCISLGLVVIYLWPRHRRLGRAWLLAVTGGYVVLALPPVANAIADRLPPSPSREAGAWRPLDTLVVLDGDNRDGRVRETVTVFSAASPRTVLLVGNLWMLDPLQKAGIPWARLKHEEDPPTTRAQLEYVGDLVNAGHSGRTAVIASRLQMPRVRALVEARDIPVVLIASPVDSEPPTSGFWRFVPTYGTLCASRDAIYEHAALAYYRWQGWIR
jgi:hypothetical protein